ncbi:MAG: hypothetical protein N2314_02895 [Brevinematales bacterium]|nr:hypothetical protein [Brevinematales bacterium]
MKRIIFFIVGIYTSLWAIDWQAYNLEVVSSTNKNAVPVVVVRDQQGFVFSVENTNLLSEKHIGTLLQVKEVMAKWTRIVPESLSFLLTENGMDILLLPKVVIYRGQDIAPYIPSGMRFFWRVGLVYDFRMIVGTNLVRIRGSYESEEELLARMQRAVMYPTLYMRSEDMDILLQKVESVEERQVILEAENVALKKLWLAYLNRNLFGQLRPIADDKIEKVVSLKKTHPHWGRKDIYHNLLSEGVKISQKEVDLILLVYFGE